MADSIYVYGVLTRSSISMTKDKGFYDFNPFMRQWPTRTVEAAVQEPLNEWIRDGSLSHQDSVTG